MEWMCIHRKASPSRGSQPPRSRRGMTARSAPHHPAPRGLPGVTARSRGAELPGRDRRGAGTPLRPAPPWAEHQQVRELGAGGPAGGGTSPGRARGDPPPPLPRTKPPERGRARLGSARESPSFRAESLAFVSQQHKSDNNAEQTEYHRQAISMSNIAPLSSSICKCELRTELPAKSTERLARTSPPHPPATEDHHTAIPLAEPFHPSPRLQMEMIPIGPRCPCK